MDLLFITPCIPDANGSGVERRAWSHLGNLADHGQVSVLATLPGAQMADASQRLAKVWGVAARALALPLAPGGEQAVLSDAQRAELTGWPHEYQRVFGFRVSSHPVWQQLGATLGWRGDRLAIDFDDIESIARRRAIPHLRRSRGLVRTAQELLAIAHTRRLEDKALRQADHVLVCSTQDRDTLAARRAHGARIGVLPNTIDLAGRPPLPPPDGRPPHRLLFLGAMNYPPNVDGADYLVNQILPPLRAALDGPLALSIVGFKPLPRVQRLGEVEDVTVTGAVPDTTPYYQQAVVCLVPLRFGGGTRIKILEAMACGRPVVSTGLGAEGLEVSDGEDILLADTPEAFAAAVARLIGDPALWQRLVDNGRRLVSERYSREAAGRAMATLLDLAP